MSISVTRNEPLLNVLTAGESLGVGKSTAKPLTESDESDALAFLAKRPIHTICMASYIRDNGVVSPHNRGTFYGYRNAAGALAGVALIGHATLIETRDDDALSAFARLEVTCATPHFIRGEREMIERFRRHLADFGKRRYPVSRELLLEQTSTREPRPEVELQLATLTDLEAIMAINAQLIETERGSSPVKNDPAGFRLRIASRIERGRFWLVKSREKIIFKADIFAEVPEAAYLEGIYVAPEQRGKGLGTRCLSQLGRILLTRTKALCLLANENDPDLKRFYERAGYNVRAHWDTIYLQPHLP